MSEHPSIQDTGSSPDDEPKTLAEAAYRQLRRDIIEGVHKPGEKLRVEHLKDQYEVGAGTLREALQLLATDALVGCLEGDGSPFCGTAEGAASRGVPSFVLGGRVLSGAQPVERLLASLRQAVVAESTAAQRRIAVPASRVPAPGKRALIEEGGRSLVLFNIDGRFHAIDDGCPHQGASLCGGKLEGEVIQCCAHGLRFNLNTGYLLNSTALKVASYPVEVQADGRLFIVIASEESAQ